MKRLWQSLAFIGWFSLYVAGCGGGGSGAFLLAAPAASTTPAAPAALVASPGDSQVALNWPQVAKATAYKVYRGTAPGVTKASLTNFTSTTNKYVDTSVSNGTTYYYMVTPIDSTGEGAGTPEASAKPQVNPPPFAPTDIYTSVGPGSIALAWTPPAGATSYNIYYGTTPGVTKQGTKINVPVATNWWGIASGLTNGTKYYLAMTAVNANGESPLSVEVSATPGNSGALMPPTPTAKAGNNKVDLSWSGITGVTVSYNVYMATCSPVIPGPGTLVASGITGTSTTIASLNPGTTYYFVLTVIYANTETLKSSEANATPTASSRGSFGQSDLVATWNVIHFYAGPGATAGTGPGWVSGTTTVDATGNVTVSNLVSNQGPLPNPGTLKWTMNADGTISESGTAAFGPTTHLIMSANKEIIVGTSTNNADQLVRIMVKQNPVMNFTAADLASMPFVFNQLDSGASNIWGYGTGSTDATGTMTVNNLVTPGGLAGGYPQGQGILSIDANGLVKNNLTPSFHGIMTPDKKVIFFVYSPGGGSTYRCGAIFFTGQTFALPDLAGTWFTHEVVSSPTSPGWEHATITVNGTGSGTASSIVDNTGAYPNVAFTATLSSTGVFGVAGTDVYGFMSYNKDVILFTSTLTAGAEYGLDILVK